MGLPTVALKAWQKRPQVTVSSQLTTALLATGAGLGAFLGIRAVVKNFKQGIRERQALTSGNPAAFATQLKMAFENDNSFGWGTDEELVFTVLESIPDWSTWLKVQKAYRDLNSGRSLAADLKEELSIEEYAMAMQIINSKS